MGSADEYDEDEDEMPPLEEVGARKTGPTPGKTAPPTNSGDLFGFGNSLAAKGATSGPLDVHPSDWFYRSRWYPHRSR